MDMSELASANLSADPLAPTEHNNRTPEARPAADFGLLVILVLPWAIFLAGNNWIFDYVLRVSGLSRSPYIDPWVYFGFFLDLRQYIQIFPGTYYGSRLSWILPGYIIYKIFPPIASAYVLHLGVYYAAVFSLYLTLKQTVGQRAALVGTTLMGCYGYFLLAVGWDYVDGAGITYFLLTTMALTFAAKKQRAWPWLIVSGAFYGAMVYSQLFLVVLTPPILLYYIAADRENRRIPRASTILFFASGFLAITALLGAINHGLGGDFLFFEPSIREARNLMGKPNPWKPQLRWKATNWLVLPSYIGFCSIGLLSVIWKFRFDRKARFIMIFQAYFLICAAIMIFFQELKGSPVLELQYYASYLIPVAFLALGAQFAAFTDRMASRHFVLVVCAAILIPLSTYRFSQRSAATQWANLYGWSLLVAFLLIAALLLLRGGHAKIMAVSCVACLVLATVNVENDSWRTADPTISKNAFSSIVESVRFVSSFAPNGRVLFWYPVGEEMGGYYRSVASAYLWGYSLLNEQFPSLARNANNSGLPAPNQTLVVLSSDLNALQEADSVLNQIGLGTQLIAKTRIQEGNAAWAIFLANLHTWPMIEDISFTKDEWPESIRVRSATGAEKVVSLVGPKIRQLFRSDLNNLGEWQVNRYGLSGGLIIQPDCLAVGDPCGRYTSGGPADHLATPFFSMAGKPAQLFFSIWIKALPGGSNPHIYIQNENFLTLAEPEHLSTRPGGWVLYGERFDVSDAKQLRLVVQQSQGSPTLLDKALLLELPPPAK
jgi:hypothetical protein